MLDVGAHRNAPLHLALRVLDASFHDLYPLTYHLSSIVARSGIECSNVLRRNADLLDGNRFFSS